MCLPEHSNALQLETETQTQSENEAGKQKLSRAHHLQVETAEPCEMVSHTHKDIHVLKAVWEHRKWPLERGERMAMS